MLKTNNYGFIQILEISVMLKLYFSNASNTTSLYSYLPHYCPKCSSSELLHRKSKNELDRRNQDSKRFGFAIPCATVVVDVAIIAFMKGRKKFRYLNRTFFMFFLLWKLLYVMLPSIRFKCGITNIDYVRTVEQRWFLYIPGQPISAICDHCVPEIIWQFVLHQFVIIIDFVHNSYGLRHPMNSVLVPSLVSSRETTVPVRFDLTERISICNRYDISVFKITFRQEYILDPNSDRQCVNSVEVSQCTGVRTLLTSAYLVEYTYLYSTYQCAYVDATYLCYAVNATLND
ncbi:hypothetical protein Tsp_05848 [Trichinella spiralis]|uniref:hypothetical protein n=1 Tax=Trichinella spiralis TaxID=6334 RepID=UPI0001EFC3CA|nr:hypothetical protein Tsp_05848 [Trichinella spiralis]